MEVWQILSHSFLRLLGDFEKLIKITGVLIALIMLPTLQPVFFPVGLFSNNTILSIIIEITIVIILLIVPFWVYVATTRFMLRGETPSSIIPKFHGKIIFLYFWRTFLLIFCVCLPLLVCFGFLDYIFSFDFFNSLLSSFMYFIQSIENPPKIPVYEFQLASKSKFILFIFFISCFYFFNRLGLILSATAIDVKFRMSDSWQATKGYDVLIILLSILTVVSTWSGIYINSVISSNPTLLSLYLIFINFFGIWWWVSVQTTLYQYLVEKRPLVEV